MKTAEEILKDWDFVTTDDYNPVYERMKKAINEARKDAIEACAEKAEVAKPEFQTAAMGINNVSPEDYKYFHVDEDSILSLIKELI